MTIRDNIDQVKHLVDLSSFGLVIATLMSWLPHVGAVLSVAWLAVRLYNEIMLAIYRARARRTRAKVIAARDDKTTA